MAIKRDERRTGHRFPIERDVQYKVISKGDGEVAGSGKTINLSSTGVFCTAEHPLVLGGNVEVAISWPAQLEKGVKLQLVARGQVVRSETRAFALEIKRYEFRTQRRS